MSFRRVKSSTAQVVSDLARAVTKELTDHDFNTLFAASVQDAAAKSVARHLNVEVETCDMHDGDKVGGSAIGELVRKNGRGGDKNPFKPGKDLMQKLRDQAKHFHSSHTHRVNYEAILEANPDLPKTSIERDLNQTRMSSQYNLVRSSLRLKRSVQMYFLRYNIQPYLNELDWKFCMEVEAILMASKDLVTLAQTETKLNAAYGPVMRLKGASLGIKVRQLSVKLMMNLI